MSPILIFLAGLLVLPVGFGLTALTLRLLAWVLGKVSIDRFKNGAEVDTWAVAHVAARLAASHTRVISISFAGWAVNIISPAKRPQKQRSRETEHAVAKAVREALNEAGYPTRAKTY